MAATELASLAGQTVRGENLSVPWWPGQWEVTQGWGQTDFDGEPEGHGYQHWHAGADIGVDCGTVISIPHGITATARWLDNPGGYGTALRLEQPNGQDVDILFGHLRQRLVSDGQQLRGGEQIAVSNNTGNSTGCHVHFEVRPHGGRYGTDVDPSRWLIEPEGATAPGGDAGAGSSANKNPYNPLDPRNALWQVEHDFGQQVQSATSQFIAGGQVLLGGGMVIGGLVAVGFGFRGQDAGDMQAAGRRLIGGVRQARQRGTYEKERATQGAIARDLAEQEAERRGIRQSTIGAYRAGLISRQEAQRRLGEPVRATGPRPKKRGIAFGQPGVYRVRGGRQVVDLREPSQARVSRLRPNLRPKAGASAPAAGAGPPAPYSSPPPF